MRTLARALGAIAINVLASLVLSLIFATQVLAASPGCTAVNSGLLNYSGSSPAAHLGVVLGEFYPGDQLFMTYTTNTPKAGVILDLILTSVSVRTQTTGSTGTTFSQNATVGALLPIGAQAGITDLTAVLNPRNVVMTVTCTPAPAPATMSIAASPASSVFGQSTALTATLSSVGGQPSGNVVFTIDGVAQAPVPIVNGVATLNTSALTVGGHTVSASYAGNSSFTSASATLPGGVTVSKASTTTALSSSAANTAFGSSVTFTATASATAPGSGTPAGSIIFTVDNVDQAPITLSGGVATFSTSALGVGNHQVSARYVGNASYNGSASSTAAVTVAKAATSTAVTQSAASTVSGDAVTFRATVSSAGGTPSGSVVFSIDDVAQAPQTLSNGVAELTISSLAVGNRVVTASYAGSATMQGSIGTLSGGHTVTAIETTTTLSAPGPITYGATATITAAVTSGRGTPTGNVVFAVNGVNRAPVALSNGSASISLSGLDARTHAITAVYAGTATFGTSTGTLAGGQVVNKAATTTTVNAISPVVLGQSVSVLATVASGGLSPDGTIVFTVDGTAYDPIAVANGQASLVVPGLGVGNHSVSAAYSGSTKFIASSGSQAAVVNQAPSSLAISSSANPSVAGQAMTFTATATSNVGTPTGQVVFTIDNVAQTPVQLSNGTASLNWPAMSVGNHTVSAVYGGNSSLVGSSATLAGGQVVERAATQLSVAASAPASQFNAPVTFTAQVAAMAPGSGLPSGDVVFTIDGVAQAPVALSGGSASITRSNLSIGTHTVSAVYAGSGDYAPSAGILPGSVTIGAAATTTTLAFLPATPRLGDTATLTATVGTANGAAAGAVIFTVNSVDQTPVALVNGVAQFAIPNLATGTYTLGARLVASAQYQASDANSVSMTVQPGLTTTQVSASPGSVRLGETVVVSATVTATHGTPMGDVEFLADGTVIGRATLNSGSASLPIAGLARGSHVISANYLGSTDHATSSGEAATPVAVTAGATTVVVSASPQPARFGQAVTLSALVSALSGTPGGTVTFSVDGADLPAVLLTSGAASVPVPGLTPGRHTVLATYSGSTDYLASDSALSGGVTIDRAVASLSIETLPVNPVFGEATSVRASLTSPAGTPSGDVVFVVDGVALDPVTTLNGVATANLPSLSAGTHAIEARFAGDARFEAITDTLAGGLVIGQAATDLALTVNAARVEFGAPVALSAKVTSDGGTPTGSVVFTIDGIAQQPVALSNGTAVLTTSGLAIGMHTVSATYAAQGNFGTSSATLSGGVDIDVAATRVVVSGPGASVAVGETARFTASVEADHGTPAGQVIFSIDGVERAPVTLVQGVASIDVTFPTAGAHVVHATYSGAATFAPSDATLTGGITIVKATAQPALTLPATSAYGAPVTASVTVTSTGGAPGGSVTVLVDDVPVGTAILENGAASLVLPALSSGDHDVVARYEGDLNFAGGASGTRTISVLPADVTLAISASAGQITAGEPVTITVRATTAYGSAAGDVTVTVGAADYQGTFTNGVATILVTGLAEGVYSVTAVYDGSSEYAPETAALGSDLIVSAAPTDIQVTADLPRSVDGVPYSGSFSAYGGVGPYEFEVSDGALPPNLTLDRTTGVVEGTPVAGSYTWEVTVTGSAGAPGIYRANLTVLDAVTIVLPGGLPAATYRGDYTASVAASGTSASVSYVVSAGRLPRGLSLNSATGAISGEATEVIDAVFTITATDTNGFVGTASYILSVVPPVITVDGAFGNAIVGGAYAGSVTVTGGMAPYNFALDGTLPDGLVFNAAIGAVSGAPTQAGSAAFAILASDAHGFTGRYDVAFDIEVQPIVVLPSTLAAARENRAYAQALSATGGTGPYTYSVVTGDLPVGVTLNTTTGRLSGTPRENGRFIFEIEASDANALAGRHVYTLDVAPAAVLVVGTTLDPVTAGLDYSDFITVSGGTGPYTFEIVSGALPAGMELDTTTGEIHETTLVPGTYTFTVAVTDAGGDWVLATVGLRVVAPTIGVTVDANNAAFGETVTGIAQATGGTAPFRFAVSAGALPRGVSIVQATGVITGTATQAGQFTATISATDANGFVGTATVEIAILAPTLTLSALPDDFRIGRPVTETLVGGGGRSPYSYAVTSGSLPAGMALDATSGALTGTPLALGERTFTITATDADAFVISRSYTVEIVSNAGTAQLPTVQPPAATAGVSYSTLIEATGGAAPLRYSITAGGLPSDLRLDPATGEISGITAATGNFTFELTVTDADHRANSATYTLVSIAPVISADGQPPAGIAGTSYAGALLARGGVGPYVFDVQSGSLPLGLTLDPSGQITGTPRQAGVFELVVIATDDNDFAATLTYRLEVAAPELVISATTPNGQIGRTYNGNITASNGIAPFTYAVTGGALPAGVDLDANSGALSGEPTASGSAIFTITATDSFGFSAAITRSVVIATNVGTATMPATLMNGVAGDDYDATVAASGGTGPYRYEVTVGALPDGLSLNATTGIIDGVPTQAGQFTFSITVRDALDLINQQAFTLDIAAPVVEVDANPPPAEAGEPYSAMVTVSGGTAPYSFAMVDAPPGLTIDNTGEISGQPSRAGLYTFSVVVTDTYGFRTVQAFTLRVASVPIPLDMPAGVPVAVVDERYVGLVVPSNAVGSATYTLVNGTQLPAGLTLGAGDGIISGAPTTVGTFSFDIRAVDEDGNIGEASYQLVVEAAAVPQPETTDTQVAITASSAVVGETVSVSISVTSSNGPANGGVVALVDRNTGTTLASGALAADGTLALDVTFPTAGTVDLVAQYAGTSSFAASNSAGDTITVGSASTSVSISGTSGTVLANAPILLVAQVSRQAPSSGPAGLGDIVFTVDGADRERRATVSGSASYSFSLPPGTYLLGARYEPSDTRDAGSASTPVPLLVTSGTITTLSGPTSDVEPGAPVVYTATVTPDVSGVAIDGEVIFTDNGSVVATVPVSGNTAIFSTTAGPLGTHEIVATFSSDSHYDDSASPALSYLVVPPTGAPATATTTTLTSTTTTPQIGESVQLHVEVRGTGALPTGSVTLVNITTGVTLGTVELDAGGNASIGLVLTDLGTTTIRARYEGDASNLSSEQDVTLTVAAPGTQLTLTPSASAVVPGDRVTLSAQVERDSGGLADAGTIAFLADGIAFAHVPTNGNAVVEATSDPLSDHTEFVAEFIPGPGSVDAPAASNAVTVNAVVATPLVVVSAVIASDGSASGTVSVTAPSGVGQVPGGDVTLQATGVADQVLTLSGGTVAFTYPAGTFGNSAVIFTADYGGDFSFAAASGSTTATITPSGNLSVQLSSNTGAIFSVGQVIVVSADISATAGAVNGIVVTSSASFNCPRTALPAGQSMTCSGQYLVTESDLAAGQLIIGVTVSAANTASVSQQIVLGLEADTVSETFRSLGQTFVADRARSLGTALPLPNIFTRRLAGTRAGTVQASTSETSQLLAFSSSLVEWRNWGAAQAAGDLALGTADEPLPVNVWIDAQMAVHASASGDEAWGRLGTFALGADYLVTEDFFAGVMVQGDWASQTGNDGDVSGSGFLIGPYASIALNETLSLDAAVLYGRSSNTSTATLFGQAFRGDFETSRLYAKAALSGYFEVDQLTLRPNATFLLTSETTDDYVVTNGSGALVSIPGGDHLQYQLTVGGTAEYEVALEDGATLTPIVGLDLGFNDTVTDGQSPDGSLLGRLTTGVRYRTDAGFELGVEFRTEIDSGGFSSAGARATIRGQF
ncbi:Putative Ig domain-containing protein [Devosia lucknowensis]|uniref:Putative Ig domain-containing protein n=1 Tax=Devosia lucknowensis TaxID=1096929 RepID=A0A1Y6G7V7_9HYPH|nr:Ig-like domain repeat protein [Devosia lucknowensis]SMQ86186.1 Putative Ig domain-containing protein [Devosia lucknowensis]